MDGHTIKSRTLFYLTQWGDEHIVDDVIAIATLLKPWNWGTPNVCHAEKWLSDVRGRFIDDEGNYCGRLLTSTLRGDNKGTVIRPAAGVLRKPGNWLCCEVEHLLKNYWTAMSWGQNEVEQNKGYGYRDIPRQIGVPFVRDDDRNICTEVTHNFDALGGIFKKMRCPDPRELYNLYKKAGMSIGPLTEMDKKRTTNRH